MFELIPLKLMPPTRIVRYCCEYLKEFSGEGRVVMTGIRADENPARGDRGMIYRHTKFNKIMFSPILYWSDWDVWEFILENKLPYCELYDKGFTRLGCVGCPMAGSKKQIQEFQMFPFIMKKYYNQISALWVVRVERPSSLPAEFR